jgi:hypothetical protein
MKCTVSGFANELQTIEDIPVARDATAYTNSEGKTWILIINEALFFGSRLDHSLINPNQIRHFGVPVCDDPYDPHRPLGIDHENAFIPFEKDGACIFFDTYVPSDAQLEQCEHVELTNDKIPWDPPTVRLGGNTLDKNEVYIRQVRSARAYIHETDIILGSISEALVNDDATERMVSQVRIESTDARAACVDTTVNQMASRSRHSVVSPERIQEIFGVGREKSLHLIRERFLELDERNRRTSYE